MTLTIVVALVLALVVVQLFLQETSTHKFGRRQILGNRDAQPKPNVLAARLGRAKNNMMEALPLFLGMGTSVLLEGGDTR